MRTLPTLAAFLLILGLFVPHGSAERVCTDDEEAEDCASMHDVNEEIKTLPIGDLSAGPECPGDDPDGAPTCQFPCKAGETLAVSAHSTDTPPGIARIYANANCGGAAADCQGDLSCTGSGTTQAGDDATGTCDASTDEPWWSKDRATVTCGSQGATGASFEARSITMEFVGSKLIRATYSVTHGAQTVSWDVPLKRN